MTTGSLMISGFRSNGISSNATHDYSVHIEQSGQRAFTASNGRGAVLHTEWHPESGSWLADETPLAGLGACMLATVLDYAAANGIPAHGTTIQVSATSAMRPARVAEVYVHYHFPATLTFTQIQELVRVGDRCKTRNTFTYPPNFVVEYTQDQL